MTILFQGGEMAAFTPSGAGAIESTSSGKFDSAYARCAISLDGTIGSPAAYNITSPTWTEATGDFYLHFEHVIENITNHTVTAVELLDSGGTAKFRLVVAYVAVSTATFQMQYLNNSAVWTNAGSTVTITEALDDFDFFVNRSTGVMTFCASGSQQTTATGLSLSHISGVSSVKFYSDEQARYISQVIAADESTIGFKLMIRYPSGNGAHTAWTGAYTDVDEAVYDDADFASAGSTGLKESYTHTGPSLPSGYVVRSVGVAMRGKTSGGVNNAKALLRISSTDYTSSSIAFGAGYAGYVAIWEDDPSTTVDWANAQIANVQFGMESA